MEEFQKVDSFAYEMNRVLTKFVVVLEVASRYIEHVGAKDHTVRSLFDISPGSQLVILRRRWVKRSHSIQVFFFLRCHSGRRGRELQTDVVERGSFYASLFQFSQSGTGLTIADRW